MNTDGTLSRLLLGLIGGGLNPVLFAAGTLAVLVFIAVFFSLSITKDGHPQYQTRPLGGGGGGKQPAAASSRDQTREDICILEHRIYDHNTHGGAVDLFSFLGLDPSVAPLGIWLSSDGGGGGQLHRDKLVRDAARDATTRFIDEISASERPKGDPERARLLGSLGQTLEGGNEAERAGGLDIAVDENMAMRRLAIDVGMFLADAGMRARYVAEVMPAIRGRKSAPQRTKWMSKFCGELWAG